MNEGNRERQSAALTDFINVSSNKLGRGFYKSYFLIDILLIQRATIMLRVIIRIFQLQLACFFSSVAR